ncbi:GNAT family N-acetyltransferase [Litoribrevibacter albus]|uniref:GNAT family N-acetyltransferase n=2 Tax=Litoribrevibacter albus TaxID=1473156 RepID=A0AA37S734_9GAMM|nr:GNAT family N-acetyltransferase [Litoribrevibacter albus]
MSCIRLRPAKLDDLTQLVELEEVCFPSDRLSKRSFRRYIQADHSNLWVAEDDNSVGLLAYGLILCHRGTRLARLYSLAVSPNARGQGLGLELLAKLEAVARERGRLYMRLEVAENNLPAIRLYQQNGYRIFGEYDDYYQDHSDALRMQKQIRTLTSDGLIRPTPWYSQTTDFTCGPAALMMAMASLTANIECSQSLELDLWREATTIFMTSGLGGCHPFGLALAARRRGFESCVWVNSDEPLFVDGVRSEQKKQILIHVHQQFEQQCSEHGVVLTHNEVSAEQVETWLQSDYAVLLLISTYRLDGKKAPHWVVVTGMDSLCFYLHDPDLDEDDQLAIDRQHIPIAREDFSRMSSFGSIRLRTAVALRLTALGRHWLDQQKGQT